MLKTDQVRKTGITDKVGKAIGQQPVVARRNPQYLEVALENSRKDSEQNNVQQVKHVDQDNKKQKKINYVPLENYGNKHVSDVNTVDPKGVGNSNKATKSRVQLYEKRAKVGKVGQQQKSGTTFQSQKQFENKENQRLYEELDQMLSGAQSLQVSAAKRQRSEKKQPETKQPEKEPKPVKVKLKKPVGNPEPELVLEYKYKREPPSRIDKHGFFGPEGTKVWQESEQRAKDVLEKLDHIDDFSFGDYSSRSKKLEAERRAKFAEYADKPIHESAHHVTGTVTSRNHIVADIPIYVPSISDNKTVERRPVYETVIPNAQSQNPYNVTPGAALPPPVDPLDTYRQHANPVSERILLERAERERLQLEKETLEFFDTGVGLTNEGEFGLTARQLDKANSDKINGSVVDKQPQEIFEKHKASDKKNSLSAGRKKTPELNHTRGSRNTFPGGSQVDKHYRENSYEKYKYSPEGFQAHLDRKARLEKEARILSRVDQNKSVWDIEDEALAKQRSNQYPLDSKYNHKIPASMAASGNKDYETYRTRQGVDEKLDISAIQHQFTGQGTYRVSNEKQGRDFSYGERDIDQDRYSDRNMSSYRSKDVSDGSNLIPEESYSYRVSKGDLQREQQGGNAQRTARQESEEKVEYILRSKTSDSKQSSHSIGAQEKSRSGNRNEKAMQREDSYEAAVKVKMDREVSVGSRKYKEHRQGSKSNIKSDRPTRRSPVGDETRRTLAAEVVASARTEATKSKQNNEESEFSKYFMDPERPDSKSNIIPLYSDPKSYYAMQKLDQRAEKSESPVQETGYRKKTEVPKEVAHASIGTQTLDIGVNTETERDDKQTSTDDIKTDRSVKGDNMKTVKPENPIPTEAKSALETETLQGTSKPPTTKRERTRDKLTRQKTKEKTMDSQGPTTDGKESLEDLDMGYLNIDELDEGLEDNDIYVCYLVTDNGAAIGPMRLDIEDVQMGLPKAQEPDLTNNLETKETDKQEEEAEGMRNRQTGSHGLNEFSSRSHSMLMLTIDSEQQDPEDENLYITKRGKLTFVDLAGSEKVKDSNSTAETLVESNNINRSLLILGNCISSLGDPKRRQGHIPYRDSKLTKLLADSLGGNGVTLMICCITPSSHHASETMNTLRYASRAKKIRTKPVIKMDPREKLILSLKKEIKVLRNENHYLRQQLEFPAKPKGQLQKENDQNFVKIMKETNEKLMQNGAKDESGLYEMLQEYMVENESLRTENSEMQVARDKQRQEQQLLYRDNEKLMKRVDELERKVSQVQNSWQAMPRQGSDPIRSRDHSPTRGSPQYAMPGSGGRQPPNRLPPPHDLPLRDPIYTGSPSQGYNSPTGSGKGKQPSRGQPMKPPHRLNESLPQQRPVQEQNGLYMNGHPHPAQYRQNPGSPNRSNEMRMDSRRSSQSTSSDAIRDMNEKLKQELAQLEGQIHQHTAVNSRNRNIYGSQGSIR